MPGPNSNPAQVDPAKLKAKRLKGEQVVTGKTQVKRNKRRRPEED